jgi:hypothetical protein
MSKYTLSIQDTVEVPVKFTLKEGKVNKTFAFSLIAMRQPQNVIEQWVKDDQRAVKDILAEIVTGWSGQTLVMEDDKPAEFSEEAFAAMLDAPGVAGRCYLAYLTECGAKAKN